jgi:tetratricopeptide (TPR) repeat protein
MDGRNLARILILIAAGLALSTPAAFARGAAEQAAPLDEGVQLLSNGQFRQAVDIFNRIKQNTPQDPRPYFYAGIALTEMGRLSDAALELDAAVRLDNRRLEYRVFQANILARLKQNAHALEALAPLADRWRIEELATAWLIVLGEVYLRLEKPVDSLRVLEVAANRQPADARIDLARAKAHLAKGEGESSLIFFKRSIEKSPQNPEAHFELGKLLQQRNEMSEAKKALLEAVRLEPRNAAFLHRLGLVCLALDETEQAIEFLKRAEPAAPSFPQVYYALGSAHQRAGERALAAEYRKKFQEVDAARRKMDEREREVVRLIAQGENQLDQKKEAEARALFLQALELDPDRWSPHAYLAEMLLASEDWSSAQTHLARMEKLDPGSTVGKYLTARYWYRSGEFEKALTYAEQVKASQPGHADLRNLLGKIYEGLGRAKEAMQEYEVAAQLAPERSEFRENLERLRQEAQKKPE